MDKSEITVRLATAGDKEFWRTLDRHISDDELDNKFRRGQAYVISVGGEPAGIMRYGLFWDNMPFCNLLYIRDDHQREGLGRALMERWESDMREKGCGMVMTSTQVDEDAQHFYRKLGYKDAGGFVVDIPGYEQPMEMIMIKAV